MPVCETQVLETPQPSRPQIKFQKIAIRLFHILPITFNYCLLIGWLPVCKKTKTHIERNIFGQFSVSCQLLYTLMENTTLLNINSVLKTLLSKFSS